MMERSALEQRATLKRKTLKKDKLESHHGRGKGEVLHEPSLLQHVSMII
jgi:hypothetical protein